MSEAANILLVDDEPGMLRYIRTLLEVDEHKVQTATTGEEAVDQVQKGLSPDLVLLDLLMPGIDGLQTLEQLRQIKPGLKVVMLSCVSDTRKVVQAMRLGAIDYLTKPFQKAELDSVISACVGGGKAESYAGEVEELCDDVFFVAASPAMKKIRAQAALVAAAARRDALARPDRLGGCTPALSLQWSVHLSDRGADADRRWHIRRPNP